MNILWTTLTIAALVVLTVKSPQAVLTVCVDSGAQALTTTFGLCGVYCLWTGLFNVAEQCHLVEALARLLRPVNKLLFGPLPDAAQKNISLNLASNLLGIGNAATPSAIEALKVTEQSPDISRAGAMLFVINACGVQLVPTTVMGLRAFFGSANAADILLPTLLSTFASVLLGVALVLLTFRPRRTARKTPPKGINTKI